MNFALGRNWFSVALLMSIAGSSVTAASPRDLGCKGNPNLIGKCYPVRGLINLSADAAFVLWPDGPGRPVKIRAAPVSQREWPANLGLAMTNAWNETDSVTARVHGTFEVCPIASEFADEPDDPYGCIESAGELTTEFPRGRE